MNRRSFLSIATASAIASISSRSSDAASRKTNSICLFTKPFNSLSFDELANQVAKLGFDGIEAPIRPGGHIEPEQVDEQLPKLVEALEKRNLKISIMTSDINDIEHPLTERVLRTAAQCGITRYRLKYFKYDPSCRVNDQLVLWKSKLHELAALNREIGIRGLYQNHAGRNTFGAALWDLAEVLQDIPPDEIAVAYDIRHATVEGGMSWPTTLRRIIPHVDTVYIKDFQWTENGVVNVPLGNGRVDPGFIDLLAESQFCGPISLHEEYLSHRDPSLVPQHFAAIRKDFDVLKKWLAN